MKVNHVVWTDLSDELGVTVDELLDVVELPGEVRRFEDFVDSDVADAGLPTHLVGQVALVGAGVAHHSLGDLQTDQLAVREEVDAVGVDRGTVEGPAEKKTS